MRKWRKKRPKGYRREIEGGDMKKEGDWRKEECGRKERD